jgi:hypothetical protein
MNMFKKSTMKAIPLAAMTAALLFGAAAQAQTGSAGAAGSAGSTSTPTDMGSPSKGAATTTSPSAAGATSAGAGMSSDTMAPPGSTRSKNSESPAPSAGKSMTKEERVAAKAEKKAASDAKKDARMKKGSTDMGSPSPSGDTGGMAPSTTN